MAKKKSSSEDINVTLQKLSNESAKTLQELANSAQIQVQKLANEATEKSFQYNSAEAQKSRDWNEYMSNTSHQRETADLRAAGLNPVLSVNQGAMSYTSASANAQAESGAQGSSNISSGLVGSLAGLAESSMANKANIHMNKVQAEATKQAAATSAAAMKAAAAASAAAQRYAADKQYLSQKYAWDKKQEMQKYQYKNENLGISQAFVRFVKGTGAPKIIQSWLKQSTLTNKQKMFTSYKNTNNYTLSNYGRKQINTGLKLLHVPITKANQNLLIQARYGNSKVAWNTLMRQRY